MVRAPDLRSKGHGFESLHELPENFRLQGQHFSADSGLFRCSFDPRVTAVARKRSRSFCQRYRWQDTAKPPHIHPHPPTSTLPMWVWMKYHCKVVYGCMTVHTQLVASRRQRFHVVAVMQQPNIAVSTPIRYIFKKQYK